MKQEGMLSRKVITTKFDNDKRGWFTRVESRPHEKDLWKKFGLGRHKFQACIRWKVGKGYRVKLYEDQWLEGGNLRFSQLPNRKLLRFVTLLWKWVGARRNEKFFY